MPEDDLFPIGLPRAVPPARWRRNRRQSLLAAGLTGLVVTASSPSGASASEVSVPFEILAADDPDPVTIFGVDLSVLLPLAHRVAGAGELVSGVVEGPSVIAKSHHPAVSLPTTGEADGQVVVLPTRDRAAGPMTAVDLAVRSGEPVVAPVSGVVVESAPIRYEGTDHRIVIRPDANPDVEVLVIHVVGALVEPGDRVRGGTTPVAAGPRQLHFDSQIDRFTEAARGAAAPHVHVELRLASPPAA